MSTVSGVGGASSAWADMNSSRVGAMRDKMFAKVDADGSGSVDATELQGMLDHMAGQTGQAPANASDLMSKMDTDGNGTLSESELDNGMKSLAPAPSSTVDFAQQRTDGGSDAPSGAHHHHHGGPPPANSTGTDSSTDATSATSATDPLDTNGDGVVSPEERLAGDLQNLMSDLMTSADANGDKSLNASELSTFKTNFDSALDSAIAATQASGATGGASSGTSSDSSSGSGNGANKSDGVSLSSIVEMMLKQYGDAAAATSAQATTLSIAA